MQQGVQTEATCNIQQCCVRFHRALEVFLFLVYFSFRLDYGKSLSSHIKRPFEDGLHRRYCACLDRTIWVYDRYHVSRKGTSTRKSQRIDVNKSLQTLVCIVDGMKNLYINV